MHTPDSSPRKSLYYDYQVHPFVTPAEIRGESKTHPVVIVGAGPVGLAMALDMARYDIPVVLLESAVQVSEGSRAIVFTYRSMEILQQVGVAERMVEKLLPWNAGNSFYRGEVVFRMEAPLDDNSRYAPMNNLQQQYLEEYLVDKVLQNPLIDLRWGSKVVDIPLNEESVSLTVDTPEGEYQLDAEWVVAADGAQSKVRNLTGLRMEGDSFEGRFVIADIEIEIDLPTERLAFFDPDWNPGNTVLMHREPGNIWRIDYQLPKDETPEQALQEDLLNSRIQAQLDMVGVKSTWELDWCSVYSARAMTLQDYVHKRIVFAGDAAHMLPIFGVRGANTGWQDGHNLIWKLAAVVKDWGGQALLDTYSEERVTSAWEIIDEASKSTRFMTPPTAGYKLLRDATLSLSLSQPFVRPLFHWRTSRPHHYIDSALNSFEVNIGPGDKGICTGSPVSNVKLGSDNYLLDHMHASFYLFHFSKDGQVAKPLIDIKDKIQKRGIPFDILSITSASSSTAGAIHIHDPDDKCAEVYASGQISYYLVRPDQHVCARWQQVGASGLEQAIMLAVGLNM
ncbi:MAG: FAD-dependent oxidoreductase [Gammaproteobacteria bacterium]|jgi:3-(3-hydroxy-phenyl)propionate hydroxylase|nr:FAD-dependent oxidoreductase [Gammaproteobacteria bacterium]